MHHSTVNWTKIALLSGILGGLLTAPASAEEQTSGQKPGLGDDRSFVLERAEYPLEEDAWDIRLRRQGMAAERDGHNRISGYRVYTHGHRMGTPISH